MFVEFWLEFLQEFELFFSFFAISSLCLMGVRTVWYIKQAPTYLNSVKEYIFIEF